VTVAPFESVDALLNALARGKNANDEPNLDVLSHSLQCAHLLRTENNDAELATAGLVHDVWDAVAPGDHTDHDTRGAALVAPLLGSRVATLVAGHVQAKRYLVTMDAHYRDALSGRSTVTLAAQGDAMTGDEARAFETTYMFEALIALRRADERAKVPGAAVPPLAEWRSLLLQVAAR
jgi:predicted HD phosphohydrolase